MVGGWAVSLERGQHDKFRVAVIQSKGRVLDTRCGIGANRQGVGEVGVCVHGNFVVFGASIAGMVGHPLSKWN